MLTKISKIEAKQILQKYSHTMARIADEDILLERTREKYLRVSDSFNELSRRLWAGNESLSIGYGGIAIVSRATGLSKDTVRKGMDDIKGKSYPFDSIRREGGGRKGFSKRPDIMRAVRDLVESSILGDPQSPMRWISKSLRHVQDEMNRLGYEISYVTVGNILHDMDFNLKGNKKTREGKSHPDRNEQFQHINDKAIEFMESDQPVISVDTKKKELIGNFRNAGKEWKPPDEIDHVNVYDFLSDAEGKAIPYGIYDIKNNEGWVSIGIDHDTAEFAVGSIRRWWDIMGRKRYPHARKLRKS